MAYTSSIPAVGNAALSDIPLIAANFTALRCCEAGAAEPSGADLAVGVLWLDTGNSILKICSDLGPPVVWRSLVDFTDAGMPKAHIADTVTSSNTVHGVKFGHGNGIDADTLDSKELTELTPYIISGTAYQSGSGTSPYARHDDEAYSASGSLVKIKEFTLNLLPSSTVKTYFEIKGNDNNAVYGRVYKNGVSHGTLRTVTSSTYTAYTESLSSFSQGDTVELWISKSILSSWVYVRNFRLLGTTSIEITL